MERYLNAECSADEESRPDSSTTEIYAPLGLGSEEVLRRDFDSLHNLLEEMSHQTKQASVNFLVFGLL
jgi:hypothetical protein